PIRPAGTIRGAEPDVGDDARDARLSRVRAIALARPRRRRCVAAVNAVAKIGDALLLLGVEGSAAGIHIAFAEVQTAWQLAAAAVFVRTAAAITIAPRARSILPIVPP